jgi:hypothetical protein
MTLVAIVVLLGLAMVNFLGLLVARYFGTLIFLDTIGTAAVAFAGVHYGGVLFGSLSAAIIGVVTNLLIGLKHRAYRKFFHVNMISGLIWGYTAGRLNADSQSISEVKILVFIAITGMLVALCATITSFPVRIFRNFSTEHLLDKISSHAWASSDPWYRKATRVFSIELLVSCLPDKILSTTVGVICFLELSQTASDLISTYRDLVSLLTAYYFIALGWVFRTLGPKQVREMDEFLLLVSPLGFFAILNALPILLRLLDLKLI